MKAFASRGALAVAAVVGAMLWTPLSAQDRLKSMPGYDQFQKMSRKIPGSVKLGSLTVQWKEDGSSFEYTWDAKRYRYDVAAKQATVIGDAPAAGHRGPRTEEDPNAIAHGVPPVTSSPVVDPTLPRADAQRAHDEGRPAGPLT